MGRVLAIDYGTKRTGIAVTDPLRIIATPLETVASAGLLIFLVDYTKKETVDEFVVGMPKTLLNEDSAIAPLVRKFVEVLKETRALVANAVKEGKTIQQMKQEHLLAKYEDKGKGFIKADGWIDVLYADVLPAVLYFCGHK